MTCLEEIAMLVKEKKITVIYLGAGVSKKPSELESASLYF